jgi:hypothetical protein
MESYYFIKQLLYGFRVWMAWSKHLGMLLELRKARKITRLRLVISRAFLNSLNIPACLDQVIQNTETIK